MFDLNATDGSVRTKRASVPDEASSLSRERPYTGNALDSDKMQRLHTRLLDLYTREVDRQYENRMEMASDADFYDNIQWRQEDIDTLTDRGQLPIVYNVISASVDWVTGTEKKTRTDGEVLPRRKADAQPAKRKTELLKYLSDVNRSPFDVSRAFEDAVKVGLGWVEDGVRDEDEDEPIYGRYESWRNLIFDSAAQDPFFDDGRYIFRAKWVDEDIAAALFKKRRKIVESAVSKGDDFTSLDFYGDEAMDSQEIEMEQSGSSLSSDRVGGYQRRRVRLIEAWFVMPVMTERMRGGAFRGELYDPASPGHQAEVEEGNAELVSKPTLRMHVAIFTETGMLWFSRSPYRHNRYPFTPIWAYRRDRDGLPYGLIRRVKDIQDDINKRASKALHILSTNKIIMDDDALPDDMTVEDLLEEAARPDAVIRKKKGSELKFDVDRELSQYQLELMSRSIGMIQQASGVTDELLGRKTNAVSGIAIGKRQDQGSLATAKLFDNLFWSSQVRGEKQLSLVEQFVSEEKAFRITNMRGKPEFLSVNDGLPENDITRSKADFVISESQWHATLRQAAVDKLMEVIARMPPQVGMVLLDLAIENMDLPNAAEIVKRIRALNGQSDPDQEEPTPEEQARAQAQAALQQLQLEGMKADLAKKLADVDKVKSEVEKTYATIADLLARQPGYKVDQQNKAITAAQSILAAPASAHVADSILADAGFTPATDQHAGPIGLGISPPQQPSRPQLPPPAGAAPATPEPQQSPGLVPA